MRCALCGKRHSHALGGRSMTSCLCLAHYAEWPETEADKKQDTQLWEATWDDDAVGEDFQQKLKAELDKSGMKE